MDVEAVGVGLKKTILFVFFALLGSEIYVIRSANIYQFYLRSSGRKQNPFSYLI